MSSPSTRFPRQRRHRHGAAERAAFLFSRPRAAADRELTTGCALRRFAASQERLMPAILPVSILFTGILTLVQVPLTVVVALRRGRTDVPFLDGGDDRLLRLSRAHANFAETVPAAGARRPREEGGLAHGARRQRIRG